VTIDDNGIADEVSFDGDELSNATEDHLGTDDYCEEQ
jgi:hypothetical protein